MDSIAQYLTLYSNNELRNPSWIDFDPDPNHAMIEEFVASIQEDREPCVTWSYQALRVALAAYESAKKKEPVRLDHPSR
jgi:predicted dehydrogenase